MGSVVQRKLELHGKREFRATLKGTDTFVHLDGKSFTKDESYAWYGSLEQFQTLKQRNILSGVWKTGTKWVLKRAWLYNRDAKHAETEYA